MIPTIILLFPGFSVQYKTSITPPWVLIHVNYIVLTSTIFPKKQHIFRYHTIHFLPQLGHIWNSQHHCVLSYCDTAYHQFQSDLHQSSGCQGVNILFSAPLSGAADRDAAPALSLASNRPTLTQYTTPPCYAISKWSLFTPGGGAYWLLTDVRHWRDTRCLVENSRFLIEMSFTFTNP